MPLKQITLDPAPSKGVIGEPDPVVDEPNSEMVDEVAARIIYLNNPDPGDLEFLEANGIVKDNLYRIARPSLAGETETCLAAGLTPPERDGYVADFLNSVSKAGLGAREEDFAAIGQELRRFEIYNVYLRTLARNGTFAVRSLFGDEILCTSASYVVTSENWPTVAYEFGTERKFYIVSNGALGNIIAVYIEDLSTLVMLKGYRARWGRDPRIWVADFAAVQRDFAAEIAGYKADDRKTFANLLYSENIAHYYWNFLTGLFRDINRGNRNLAVFSRRAPFDPFPLFPEQDGNYPDSPKSDREIALKVFADRLIVGLNTDYIASEALCSRVTELAQARVSARARQEIGRFARKNKLIFWILLRNIHRSWLNQVDGLCELIPALIDRYGDCGFIFDGHTSLDEGPVKVHTQKALRDSNNKHMMGEESILESILGRISVPNHKSLIGASVYEKILWGHVPTLTIQPMGTGFLWTGWITNRPAVLHTPPQNIPEFRCTAYMREGCTPKVYVGDEYYANSHQERMLSSYDLDWRGIYEAVGKLMDLLGQPSTAAAVR